MLMSVYAGEKPDFLRAALTSIREQTELPDEVILIKDGYLDGELERVIKLFSGEIGIRSIQLQKNVGLSKALNIGLEEASHPWIMRFDTDDVNNLERVARQRALISGQKLDIFGCQIEEFNCAPSEALRTRYVPLRHDEILAYAKRRNPFNHMTVCYRKSLALECGGYPDIPYMEDYGLWIKMLSRGGRASNSPETLVMARVGNGMVRKRGGLAYVASEIKLQALMRRSGFKTKLEAARDGAARSAVFMLPIRMRSLVYSQLLRKSIQQ